VLLCSGLSEGELRWCYENCCVLLAPSSLEGFGLPVAEGILAGSRIVCSDIPAFRELGTKSCRFVSAGDDAAAAYAEAVREVLRLPSPRGAHLPHLSPASIGQQYAQLYESLVCSPKAESDMLRQPNLARRREAGSHPAR
jgi:glycosyltransferase involved in cell wall biosynthesis